MSSLKRITRSTTFFFYFRHARSHNIDIMLNVRRRKTDSIELIRGVIIRIACFPTVMWNIFVIHHLQRNAYQRMSNSTFFTETFSFYIVHHPIDVLYTWCVFNVCFVGHCLFSSIEIYFVLYVLSHYRKQKTFIQTDGKKYSIQFSGQLFPRTKKKIIAFTD